MITLSTVLTRLALAGLALAVAGVTLVGAPASAHARLVGVTPTDGSTVDEAPRRVVLTFDENVSVPSEIVVSGPSGRVDDGEPEVVDNELSVGVDIAAQPEDVGTYRVAFRTMSADGHPVSGEARFRFAPPGVEAAAGSSDQADHTESGVARWAWIALAAVVVLALALLLPRRRGRTR